MYVCVCQAVTDQQIREAASNGARSLRDLRRELGVTRDCGCCASCASDCLKKANAALFKAPLAHLPKQVSLDAIR
jgi:bacterioferritin-associated ferredoxin